MWTAAPAVQYVQYAELCQKTYVKLPKETYIYVKRHVEIEPERLLRVKCGACGTICG